MVSEALRRYEAQDLERDLESFHPSSFGWALVCCDWNREEAEEVLQTAYLKAIEGRARFNGHSSTRTWFFGVVKNTAAEKRRYKLVHNLAFHRWFRNRLENIFKFRSELAACPVELMTLRTQLLE